MFVIHANLDAEARWAGAALPAKIAARVSPFAALLAALAPDGEPVEIWAPAAVEPARVRIPNVTMRTGTPPRADLGWARAGAKAVNDRRFALALAERLGCALPGARAIAAPASPTDVGRAASPQARRSSEAIAIAGPWVAKAPWTTAGRDRCFGTGTTAPLELRALLDRFGALVVEPWCDRVLDIATCGHASPRGIELLAPHRLVTSDRGTFRGIELATTLAPGERAELARVARAAGEALVAAGYSGPFGVDAFIHGPDRRLHPLCEINARFTFGHVAHALAARLGARAIGFGPHAPAGATPLVDGAAWLHRDRLPALVRAPA